MAIPIHRRSGRPFDIARRASDVLSVVVPFPVRHDYPWRASRAGEEFSGGNRLRVIPLSLPAITGTGDTARARSWREIGRLI